MGTLESLIMIGVVLYVGVNFVLPLAQKGLSGGIGLFDQAKGAIGMAGYADEYGQNF
jgi:hypothetical protein